MLSYTCSKIYEATLSFKLTEAMCNTQYAKIMSARKIAFVFMAMLESKMLQNYGEGEI